MTFKEFYKTLERNKHYLFSIEDIRSFYPDETDDNLKQLVYRWKINGWIYSLKRGLYEITYPKDFNIPDMFVANKLYSPSYISLETALSNYSIIPEVSMAVTSITTKPTRKFKNKHGLFLYRTIKPLSFTGYYVEKHGQFEILIAEPEKALVDYLYFKSFRNKNFSLKNERLDKARVKRLNKKKIAAYSKLYNFDLNAVKGLYAQL